ncbi:RNA polymerase sigma factor (sigma-70 family) [Amycolatopsis bartoniae]|uniref:RNA polymerase sigma factor n=1 Tax=Amycolatopsis bartoniae TaxID=941986 RepID=A0A8H9IVR5_9PSEU|nr:sigma-70 family RNA polymerase sigma factor [Amycolatopsis bartoniae]MBB2933327.1 RNA polymerase sigma factor (sigma-70 family) [Amycolatopsis bartoniae]GHF58728.1 RNA polymerase sigma factor [Amycolatopsis bartoniae]
MTEEATVPEQRTVSADEQALLRRLRAGEDRAFSELFELHSGAVRRLARGIASDASEAEDITAETFFRVLQALRRGAGPRDHVRAYLLTVARRVSWEWHGARRDVPVTDDELTVRAGAGADAHARTAEHSLIATAFTSLPERWRTVLWQTEVEGEQPAVVAPHFGLSANATAALARRARQGLRAAYLQAHLAMNRTSDVGCRGVIEKLGGYTAGSVTGSEATRIRTHLLGCASCRSMHAELRDVCSSLRAHAGVLALLVPSTAAIAAAGAGSGALTTLKGLLLSKLKIGVALASTAAAGVVGVAVGPALLDAHHSQPIGLPQSGVELRIAPTQPSLLSSPPQEPVPPGEATLQLPGKPATVQHQSTVDRPVSGDDQAVVPPPQTAPATASGDSSSSSGSVGARDDLGSTDTSTQSSKPGKGNHGANNPHRGDDETYSSRSDDTPDNDVKMTETTDTAKPRHSTFFWWLWGGSAQTDETSAPSSGS